MLARAIFAIGFLVLSACARSEAPPDVSASGSNGPSYRSDWFNAEWKGRHAGAPTQLLTLGSIHLAQSAKPPDELWLEPVLERLEAFAPDLITHENLSGEQCDQIGRYPTLYIGVYDGYCYDTEAAALATGLDVPAATARVHAQMQDWPETPSPARRRAMASLFLAAGEPASAVVQWLQLPEAERIAADGLNESLRDDLDSRAVRIGETYSIAARLAARLGHARIYPVDDHTADGVYYVEPHEALGEFLSTLFSSDRPDFYAEMEAREASIASGDDLLEFYRALNAPETARQFVENDFRKAAETPSDAHYGRSYLAWWEVRNMRMAANIRAVAAREHGGRVLSVVGASHKLHYDLYLDMIADIEVVEATAVLGAED